MEKLQKIFLLLMLVLQVLFYSSIAFSADKEVNGGIILTIEERLKKPFKLETLHLDLDGVEVYKKSEGVEKHPLILVREMKPGTYHIIANAVYRGTGYGFLPIPTDKYSTIATGVIEVKADGVTHVTIVCNDRGSLWKKLEERPFINYEISEYRRQKVSAPNIRTIIWDRQTAENLVEEAAPATIQMGKDKVLEVVEETGADETMERTDLDILVKDDQPMERVKDVNASNAVKEGPPQPAIP